MEYFEKGGAICNYPRLGYTTYSGSQMKAFTCEKGYVNCRPGKVTPITKIEPKEKYTIYWIGTGRSRGHRTPMAPGTSSRTGATTRIPTPPPSRDAAAGVIPDVVGFVAPVAKSRFADLGVAVTWRAGSSSDDPVLAGRIERQSPEPGTRLAGVQAVQLWVYRRETATVSVPDLTGMQYEMAAEQLRRVGLSPRRDVSRSTPPRGRGGTVAAQGVKPGERVAPGATVRLDVYESGEQVARGQPVQIKPQVIRPGTPGGSVDPDLPATFDCDPGVPGVRISGPSRTSAAPLWRALEVFSKQYKCSYMVNGRATEVRVNYWVKRPPQDPMMGSGILFLACEEKHWYYTQGKAISVYVDYNGTLSNVQQKMNAVFGPQAGRQILDFHVQQILPHAMTCAG